MPNINRKIAIKKKNMQILHFEVLPTEVKDFVHEFLFLDGLFTQFSLAPVWDWY